MTLLIRTLYDLLKQKPTKKQDFIPLIFKFNGRIVEELIAASEEKTTLQYLGLKSLAESEDISPTADKPIKKPTKKTGKQPPIKKKRK